MLGGCAARAVSAPAFRSQKASLQFQHKQKLSWPAHAGHPGDEVLRRCARMKTIVPPPPCGEVNPPKRVARRRIGWGSLRTRKPRRELFFSPRTAKCNPHGTDRHNSVPILAHTPPAIGKTSNGELARAGGGQTYP